MHNQLRDLKAISITWKDIYKAYGTLTSPLLSKDKAAESLDNLITALVEKRIAVPLPFVGPAVSNAAPIIAGGAVALAGPWLVPNFVGALGHFSHAIPQAYGGLVGATFAAGATETVKRGIKNWQKAMVKKKLSGWLDRLEV